jgi:hypothetical protein
LPPFNSWILQTAKNNEPRKILAQKKEPALGYWFTSPQDCGPEGIPRKLHKHEFAILNPLLSMIIEPNKPHLKRFWLLLKG